MPEGWVEATVAAIKRKTSRPVRVRKHPGNHPPEIAIEDDLDNVWAVVIWGSSAAIKALVAGVPVFYCFSPWIGGRGASLDWMTWSHHTAARVSGRFIRLVGLNGRAAEIQ